MKRYTAFLIALLFAGFLTSCDEEKKASLPGITGKAGELVVVMEKIRWNGEAGDSLISVLADEVLGLPQPEPIFDLVHVKPSNFGPIFQSHRNILVISINDTLQPKVEVKKDAWARPQVVVRILAPDVNSFVEVFEKNHQKVIEYILNKERERVIQSYKSQKDKELVQQLGEKHFLSMVLPRGYQIAREAENFMWVRHETQHISQGILVYHYNYTDTNTFTRDYLVQKRNEMTQKYVPGPTEGSYMQVSPIFKPVFEEINFNGKYAAKLTGLWDVKNDFMGGPFVSYTIHDKKRNRIITVDGFVFAPRFDKRNYMLEVDAILHSLELH